MTSVTIAKRIGFIGNPAQLAPGSKDNTGNIIHGHAARDLFASGKTVGSDSSPENIERIRSAYSHLGFVAATMLHVSKPPKYIDGQVNAAEFVEKLDLPVCVFGLGCHAGLNDTIAEAQVDPRSVRLLQILAERSRTIGVRGAFTADLCEKYGVKNVTVVGCQSAYVAALRNHHGRHIATKGDRPVVNFSFGGPDESAFLQFAMSAGADLISQGDSTEEQIKQGIISRDAFLQEHAKYWLAPGVSSALQRGAPTREAYFDYIRAHFFKFYNVPDWRDHIAQTYDFCVGTRFHGNMVALQAGVPALWVEHDMRTRELCAHLNLPSVPHAGLDRYASFQQLAEACSYDAYWAHMPARIAEFLTYLEGNGVRDMLAPAATAGFQEILATG